MILFVALLSLNIFKCYSYYYTTDQAELFVVSDGVISGIKRSVVTGRVLPGSVKIIRHQVDEVKVSTISNETGVNTRKSVSVRYNS